MPDILYIVKSREYRTDEHLTNCEILTSEVSFFEDLFEAIQYVSDIMKMRKNYCWKRVTKTVPQCILAVRGKDGDNKGCVIEIEEAERGSY